MSVNVDNRRVTFTPVRSSTICLNTDSATYSSGPFSYKENPWGKGSLVRGVDYTDSMTINLAAAPSNIQFEWSWPDPGTGAVMSYPLVNLEPPSSPYPQLPTITVVTQTFNYTINQSGQSVVLLEGWLYSDSGGTTIAHECEYFPYTRGYTTAVDQTIRRFNQPYVTLASPSVDVYSITGSWNQLFIYPVIAQTNQFDNPSMTGSVNGTPGTMPTHTSVNLNSSGLSTSVVGSGTTTAADGTTVNYVDIRVFGTPTASTNVGIQINNPSSSYFSWSGPQAGWFSAYLAIVGGAVTNFSPIQLGVNSYDSGFGYIRTTGGLNLTSTLSASLQHFGLQVITTPDVGLLQPQILFWFSSGAAVDITLRIGNVAVSNDPTQIVLSQTFDWKAFFNAAATAGLITGNEYLRSIQFGPEIVSGYGRINLSSYNVVQF